MRKLTPEYLHISIVSLYLTIGARNPHKKDGCQWPGLRGMRRCGAWGTCGVDTMRVRRKSVYPQSYFQRESLMYARVFITQGGAPRISGQCSPAFRTPFTLSHLFCNSRRASLHLIPSASFPVTQRGQPQPWGYVAPEPKGAPSTPRGSKGAARKYPKDASYHYYYDFRISHFPG